MFVIEKHVALSEWGRKGGNEGLEELLSELLLELELVDSLSRLS
jgi:hypothetical protein